MQEGTSSERVPSGVMITVRWGASILMAKRISPPRTMQLTGGVGKLELGPQGLDLVAGGERHRVVRGKRLKTVVDDVEIVIDATEDNLGLIPLAPAMDRRHAAADVGSFLLHAGALSFCFFWRTPLSHAETEIAPLRETIQEAEQKLEILEPEVLPVAALSAALAPASDLPAARLRAERRGGPVLSQPRTADGVTREALINEAATFGMIGLLAHTNAGPESPWSEARATSTLEGGNGWSMDLFSGDGVGELSLSSTGEGAGGKGNWIGLSTFGTCGDTCDRSIGSSTNGTGIWSVGHGRKGHTAKPPKVRMGAHGSVAGRLPAEAIQRVVRQSFGRFRYCYEQSNGPRAGTETRVTVKFVIGRDGSVSSAAGTSDASSSTLAPCVTKAFYGLSFPEPEGGVVTVSYPILFSPSE